VAENRLVGGSLSMATINRISECYSAENAGAFTWYAVP
jgi:hypothetical protein